MTNTCGAERDQIKIQTKEYLLHGDFDKLTKTAQQFRASKATLSDGSWKLDHFYSSFSTYNSNTNDWKQLLGKLDEWSRHETRDPAPIIAAGNALWAMGKQARGMGFADTVTDDGWNFLRESLGKDINKLTVEYDRCKSCPGYYVVMLKIGVDGEIRRSKFESLFEQGVKLEPKYAPLYETKAYYLLPRWYGRKGELREFIYTTAERYPEIAIWILWRLQYQAVYENVFREENIEWDQIKTALKKSIQSKSLGIGQANMMAYLSDIAGDPDTLAAAMKSVDNQFDVSMWRSYERVVEIAAKIHYGEVK